jgi:hypothetical protein
MKRCWQSIVAGVALSRVSLLSESDEDYRGNYINVDSHDNQGVSDLHDGIHADTSVKSHAVKHAPPQKAPNNFKVALPVSPRKNNYTTQTTRNEQKGGDLCLDINNYKRIPPSFPPEIFSRERKMIAATLRV